MDVDRDKLKNVFATLIGNLKMLETEIYAFRMLVATLQSAAPGLGGDPEALLDLARKSPNVQNLMNAKYDTFLARVLEQLDKGADDEHLLEYLRSWKPQGPTN